MIEFEVSGDYVQCIHMLPGYTHNIINLSETENLVTVMYCNEIFDPREGISQFLYGWKDTKRGMAVLLIPLCA